VVARGTGPRVPARATAAGRRPGVREDDLLPPDLRGGWLRPRGPAFLDDLSRAPRRQGHAAGAPGRDVRRVSARGQRRLRVHGRHERRPVLLLHRRRALCRRVRLSRLGVGPRRLPAGNSDGRVPGESGRRRRPRAAPRVRPTPPPAPLQQLPHDRRRHAPLPRARARYRAVLPARLPVLRRGARSLRPACRVGTTGRRARRHRRVGRCCPTREP
jgi:hypothetical protein